MADRQAHPTPIGCLVFQNYGLFPWRTVLGKRVSRARDSGHEFGRKREQRAGEYIELVGFDRFLKSTFRTRSRGGMQQRTGLARGAVDPAAGLLLMDEPFGAVDRADAHLAAGRNSCASAA